MAEPPASSGSGARESTDWLRRALSAGRVGMWEWDIASGVVTWSREVLSIFGIERFGGTVQSWTELVHPGDRELTKVVIERTLRDPSASEFRLEHRALHPSGKLVWVEGRGEVKRAPGGEALTIIGIVQDVTVRKELEQQLAQ